MRFGHHLFAAWTFSVLLCAACFGAEPTPFQQYLRAKALDETLDSIQATWEWEETREDDDAPSPGFKARAKYVFRDGFVAESESMYGISYPEMKLPMQLSYTRDGYYYTRIASLRSGRKNKRPAEQMPAGLDSLLQGVVRFPIEERFIAGQQRSGNMLRFTINVEALNAHLEENFSTNLCWEEAAFDVELNAEGRIWKIVSLGKYTRTADGKTVRLRHRGSLEVLQRGNVTIGFPSDLDTYEESE